MSPLGTAVPRPAPSHARFAPPATRWHCDNGPHPAGSGALLRPARSPQVAARGRGTGSAGAAGAPGVVSPQPLSAAFRLGYRRRRRRGSCRSRVGEEAARHEAAQARTLTRVGTVRAGPGGRCSIRPSFLCACRAWAAAHPGLGLTEPPARPGAARPAVHRRPACAGRPAGPHLPEEEAEALK